MKKILTVLLLLSIVALTSCAANLTDQESVTKLFNKHREEFLDAASTGDFTALEKIRGVRSVYSDGSEVIIWCGGTGMGSNTNYYSIVYSEEKAFDDPFLTYENGYLYRQDGGDNVIYYESLGDHFYYCEEHY